MSGQRARRRVLSSRSPPAGQAPSPARPNAVLRTADGTRGSIVPPSVPADAPREERPMIVDRSYVAENDGQRERLRALVVRLSDGELGRLLGAGWTIASVLGHLAFWDQRILVLLERWQREGPAAVPPALGHSAVVWITDVEQQLLLAAPARADG